MRRAAAPPLVALPLALLTALVVTLLPAGSPAHARGLPSGVARPDIVVVMLDDLPQIDQRLWARLPTIRRLLVEGGVRFTDFLGNDPSCCPGRANALTGQWSTHHGVTRNDARLLDPTVTVATELQAAGYWTGYFGKYLNLTYLLDSKELPGWDRTFIFGGKYWNYRAWRDGKVVQFGSLAKQYSTTQIRVHALKALRAAPPDRPRLLWLAPFAVHSGQDQDGVQVARQPAPAPVDVGAAACEDVAAWTTPAFTEQQTADKPAFLQGRRSDRPHPLVRVCESLLSVDRLLAAVVRELAAQGRPDPMIILTADNGMGWGAHGWFPKFVPWATPMPLLIRWPGLLGTAPATVATTLSNIDLAPTLCEIAGCTMGPFPNGHAVDGTSFLPLLVQVGEVNRLAARRDGRITRDGVTRRPNGRITGATLGREVVFIEHTDPFDFPKAPTFLGLRTTNEAPIGRWEYVEYATGEKELYDLAGGPCWSWKPGDPGDPCRLRNRAGDPAVASIQSALAATLAARDQAPTRIRGLKRR
jgi:arylsulfatase A-like enzyme